MPCYFWEPILQHKLRKTTKKEMHLYSRTFAEVDLTNISLQRLIGRNVNAIADEEPSQMKNQSLQTRSLYNSF